ncbi:hypothetical protein GCM10022409_16810 [Hymenobacter glaciei]|uniref:Uncharacterized protein n=1 Tax=Hymenobacter glaciei TaxID=877209 RepID=A0ABP7TYV1_9BACT
MHKHLLVSALLFGTSTSAFAQAQNTQPSTSTPIVTTSPAVSSDTVQAIHRLFKSRRTGGYILTGSSVIFTRIAVGAAGTVPAGVFVLIIGGTPGLIGFGKIVRFSVRNEAKIVSDFEKNKTLPNAIRRRLDRKYFNN